MVSSLFMSMQLPRPVALRREMHAADSAGHEIHKLYERSHFALAGVSQASPVRCVRSGIPAHAS